MANGEASRFTNLLEQKLKDMDLTGDIDKVIQTLLQDEELVEAEKAIHMGPHSSSMLEAFIREWIWRLTRDQEPNEKKDVFNKLRYLGSKLSDALTPKEIQEVIDQINNLAYQLNFDGSVLHSPFTLSPEQQEAYDRHRREREAKVQEQAQKEQLPAELIEMQERLDMLVAKLYDNGGHDAVIQFMDTVGKEIIERMEAIEKEINQEGDNGNI